MTVSLTLRTEAYALVPQMTLQSDPATIDVPFDGRELLPFTLTEKWLRKSEQGDKWNRCLNEGMIVLSETGARDEQTTPP